MIAITACEDSETYSNYKLERSKLFDKIQEEMNEYIRNMDDLSIDSSTNFSKFPIFRHFIPNSTRSIQLRKRKNEQQSYQHKELFVSK